MSIRYALFIRCMFSFIQHVYRYWIHISVITRTKQLDTTFFFISCSCVIDIYWSKWILLFAIIRDSIVEENCIAFILILSRSYVKYNDDNKTVVLHTKYSRIIMVAIEWNKIIINGLLGFRSISFHFSQIIPHQNEIQTYYVPFVIVISVKIRRKQQYSIWYSQRKFLNEMLANEQYNSIVVFQFSCLRYHFIFGKSFQRFFQSEQRLNQLSFSICIIVLWMTRTYITEVIEKKNFFIVYTNLHGVLNA